MRSLLLCEGFLELWRAAAALHCGAQASVLASLLQSIGSGAHGLQQLWHAGLAGPQKAAPPRPGVGTCPLRCQVGSQLPSRQRSPLLALLKSLEVLFIILMSEILQG